MLNEIIIVVCLNTQKTLLLFVIQNRLFSLVSASLSKLRLLVIANLDTRDLTQHVPICTPEKITVI